VNSPASEFRSYRFSALFTSTLALIEMDPGLLTEMDPPLVEAAHETDPPELTRAQVHECLAYYEDHRDEIDFLVAEQMAEPGE